MYRYLSRFFVKAILPLGLWGALTVPGYSLPATKPLLLQPDNQGGLEQYLNEGRHAYADSNWPLAIESLQKALQIEPNQYKIRLLLGTAYFNAGWSEKASIEWQKVIQEAEKQNDIPALADAHYNLGEAYEQLSKPEDAMNEFEKAIQLYNALGNVEPAVFHDVYYNLGIVYGELHHWNDASRAFEKAISFSIDDFDDWNMLTIAYGASGRLTEALVAAKHVTSLQPDSEEGHYLLGLIYCLEQNKTLLNQEYETLKRLDYDTSRLDEVIRKACANCQHH